VWIVDVVARAIEAHRQPSAEGYRETLRPGRDAVLSPALLPGIEVAVADILR
jgi:Uma2 family endonuclease